MPCHRASDMPWAVQCQTWIAGINSADNDRPPIQSISKAVPLTRAMMKQIQSNVANDDDTGTEEVFRCMTCGAVIGYYLAKMKISDIAKGKFYGPNWGMTEHWKTLAMIEPILREKS